MLILRLKMGLSLKAKLKLWKCYTTCANIPWFWGYQFLVQLSAIWLASQSLFQFIQISICMILESHALSPLCAILKIISQKCLIQNFTGKDSILQENFNGKNVLVAHIWCFHSIKIRWLGTNLLNYSTTMCLFWSITETKITFVTGSVAWRGLTH